MQQTFGLAAARQGNQHDAYALFTSPAGAAAAMLQNFGVIGQIGMDDEAEIGQIDAACRHIGCDTDPGTAIAEGLQRVVAFALAKFSRKIDSGKAPLRQRGMQMFHMFAGVAENNSAGGIDKAQHIDHGMFDFIGGNPHGPVFNVGMGAGAAKGFDAQGIFLIILGQCRDGLRHGCREHQGTALGWCGFENEFQILAETQIEHLVGFIKHHSLDALDIQNTAFQMIAQAARCTNDDMGTSFQTPTLALGVHATDTGQDTGVGMGIKPFQFAFHLHGEFARRGHNQRNGAGFIGKAQGVTQQGFGDGQTISYGFARSGLSRDDEIASVGLVFHDGQLNGCRVFIFSVGKGAGKGF